MKPVPPALVLAAVMATGAVTIMLMKRGVTQPYSSLRIVEHGAIHHDPYAPMPPPHPWKIVRRWSGTGMTKTPPFEITWAQWSVRAEAQDAKGTYVAVPAVVRRADDGAALDVPMYAADGARSGMKWSEGYFDGPGVFWLECECEGLRLTVEVHERQGE